MYPTLAALAGAKPRRQAARRVDVWPAIAEGKPSPRTEVVYDIEPFRRGLRGRATGSSCGSTTLPSKVELFNLAQDPGEKNERRRVNPAEGGRAAAAHRDACEGGGPPLVFGDAFAAVKHELFGSVLFPAEEKALERQP